MEQYDSVRTLVDAYEYPAGTLGVISEITEEGVWVDIFSRMTLTLRWIARSTRWTS